MERVLVLSRQPLRSRPLHDWLGPELTARVVLVTPSSALDHVGPDILERFAHIEVVDDYNGWNTELTCERVARQWDATRIASTSERDVLRAARLRERLGLAGQSVEGAEAYRDKLVMRRRLRAAGIAVPDFRAVDTPGDLVDFVRSTHGAVVVKPRLGFDAASVHVLRGEADLAAYLISEARGAVPLVPGQWIAEHFVTGDFFHVDGMMRGGQVLHSWPSQYNVGLAERVRDKTHSVSAMLDPHDPRVAMFQQLAREVVACLPAAGDTLPFHLEAWIDSSGRAVVCEIASRAGGAYIVDAYERSFGLHLSRASLLAQCGVDVKVPPQNAQPDPIAGWIFFSPGIGRFAPPEQDCQVEGVEVTLRIKRGEYGHGVSTGTSAAASALVTAVDSDSLRSRTADVIEWWDTGARFDGDDPSPGVTEGEHVLVLGTGRDMPARLRVSQPNVRTTVMSQVEFVHKVRDTKQNSQVIGLPATASDELWIDVAGAVHAHDPFTRIATFGERDQDRCAAIGKALGIVTHDPATIDLVRDKVAMRNALRMAGIDNTPSMSARSAADVAAFVEQHGLPCIVKPAVGVASIGVTRVDSREQIEPAWELATRPHEEIVRSGAIVEAFLSGPQISVEAFSEEGEHVVVCITRKYSDPSTHVELGHVTPAPLDDETAAAVAQLISGVLDTLGVRFGPTHTECVLTENGPVVIETHARAGGDQIPDLVLESTGVDLADLALRQVLGERVLPEIRQALTDVRPRRASAIWFGTAPAEGKLIGIAGLDSAECRDGVSQVEQLVPDGASVEQLVSSRSRIVSCRAVGDTAGQAVQRARDVVESLTVTVSNEVRHRGVLA